MNANEYADRLLDDAINGQTSIAAGELAVVNPDEAMPTGLGPGNDQPFETGATQNVRTTWVEQGWGHDSQRWPYYPFSENRNPARRRSPIGKLTDAERTNFALDSWDPVIGPEQARQRFFRPFRRSGANAHGAIVPIPGTSSYSDTVPTYGGGAVEHPGVDVPWGDLYQW